jgi:hypothetical protein
MQGGLAHPEEVTCEGVVVTLFASPLLLAVCSHLSPEQR